MADVRLVDLEVIKRFSLAVRRDTVPAEELLEALDASRAVVLAAMGPAARPRKASTANRVPVPRKPIATTAMPTKATARKATSRKATARKAAAGQAAKRAKPVR